MLNVFRFNSYSMDSEYPDSYTPELACFFQTNILGRRWLHHIRVKGIHATVILCIHRGVTSMLNVVQNVRFSLTIISTEMSR